MSLRRAAIRTVALLGLAGRVGIVGVVGIVGIVDAVHASEEEPALIRIAMLPIVVHSADDPIFLREGLADMLMARLDQVGRFAITHIEDDTKATTRLEEALAAGREAGTEYVLFGSFTRFGTGASLDMQCASTTEGSGKRPLREIFVHSGSIGEVIPDLDDLVGKISRFAIAGYSGPSAAVPTSGDPGAEGGESGEDPFGVDREIEDLASRIESLEATLEELAATVYEDRGVEAADNAAPAFEDGVGGDDGVVSDAEVVQPGGAVVDVESEEIREGPID